MLRLARPPAEIDEGITLAEAARIIGSDTTTVRELVQLRELAGWKVGKHRRRRDGTRTPPSGVRVSEASCFAYRERNAIGGEIEVQAPAPRPRARAATAIANATLDSLRAKGFRV